MKKLQIALIIIVMSLISFAFAADIFSDSALKGVDSLIKNGPTLIRKDNVKWEYKVASKSIDGGNPDLLLIERGINKDGDDGWELVSATPTGSADQSGQRFYFIFKRVQDESENGKQLRATVNREREDSLKAAYRLKNIGMGAVSIRSY